MDALLVVFLLLSFLSGATCQVAADTQEDHSIQIAILKELADTVNNLQKDMQSMKDQLTILNDGYLNPFQSCWQIAEAHPSAKSDYYWVQDSGTGQTIEVYCDMDSHCCNSTRGWMRVANVDMTDPTQQCPPQFTLKIESGVRACGRKGGLIGCTSTIFSSHGIEYGRVCGRIRAYQFGGPDAFEGGRRSIDSRYVDGISITHGSSPRKHIWTFAAASSEFYSATKACPCTRTDLTFTGTVPSFIGNDYFCDTAANVTTIGDIDIMLFTDDPLWDGQGCGPTSSCCSFNNPPWFCTKLLQPTSDDIELRMCGHLPTTNEDTPFDQIELYVLNEDVNDKTSLESLTSKVDSLCNKTNSLAFTVDSLSTSSDSLTSKVDYLSTRSDSLTSKVDSLSTRSDSLTSKVDSLSTSSDSLTSKVDYLSTRSDSLTSKVDSLSTSSDLLTSKVDSFTMIVESVREEQDSLKTVTVAVSERVESLHDKVDIQARKLTNITQNVGPITVSTCTEVIRNETAEILQGQKSIQKYLSNQLNPFPSCWYIAITYSSAKSGYYWVHDRTGQAVEVYCDMDSHYFNSTRGWMRVANVDMTDPTQQCPPEFTLKIEYDGKRVCHREGPHDCTSTTFPSHGIEYSQVCGRIRAYQFGLTIAYYLYHTHSGHTIDSNYVDGISITHGSSPRKHIWTFAAALGENNGDSSIACPCTRTDQNFTGTVPSFIGNNYFCDTAASASDGWPDLKFYTDNPLWDGQGCGPNSSCCSFNNPPWFCTQLPQPTTDDIELRMCGYIHPFYGDTPFDQIELYVWNEGPSKVNSLATKTAEILQRQHQLQKSVTYLDPLPSCRHRAEAYPSEESGYYWVRNGTGQAVEVYCDMDSHCCNSTRGWMRVANVNMTDPTQQCPPEFIGNGVRVCGRKDGFGGCTSTTFSSHGIEYGRVCGRIRAYQFGRPDAFEGGHRSIDDRYVDGISITHGSSPRKHIWTFAAALSEFHSNRHVCPCTQTDQTFTGVVPSFIGNDYFCDTAVSASDRNIRIKLYTDDPLWDGQGCGPNSSCCSFNNPPWFCTQLPQPTTDDIELRMCATQPPTDEDTPFDQIELYVQ